MNYRFSVDGDKLRVVVRSGAGQFPTRNPIICQVPASASTGGKGGRRT